MRIRVKILLTLGLILITLMATTHAVAHYTTLNGVEVSETQDATKNAERFINNLNIALANLNQVVNDWANWDDTYQFIQDQNTAYIESNIVESTFENLQINLMLLFNEDNQLVYGGAYDLIENTPLTIDEGWVVEVTRYRCLFSELIDCKQGIIEFNDIPMLVAASQILTSENEGPSKGTMIIGRFLDDQEVSILSSATGLPVRVVPFDAQYSGYIEIAKSNLSPSAPIFVQAVNQTIVSSYILISDLSGKPITIVQVDDFRSGYIQATAALNRSGLFMIALFVVIFFSMAFLLEKLVISRISSLNNTVIKVQQKGIAPIRNNVSGNDELASLGRNINSMLDVIDSNTLSLEKTVEERTRDLAESKKKFESILSASPDAIVAVDLEGKITECNPRVTELIGYDRSYLIGKRGRDFFSANSDPNLFEKIAAYFAGNIDFLKFEVYLMKKDGQDVPVEFSISPIYDENNVRIGSVGIIRDLSEKKQLEQQLLKSQRLAAIGELAGMVGHDIRNPLAAIKNADFYIKKKCSRCKDNRIVLMLNIIDKSIEHANNIVDDLLEYSKEQHIEIIDLPARQTIEKALLMVRVPKSIKLVNSVADEVLKVDEAKALRVFINLTKNAFDAMPEGGTLTITSSRNNEYTMVSFSDTGRGIPQEALSKLFTPLFTTKAQGMGFGLSISKRIMEAHGGKIEVQTAPKKGTTVTVAFSNNPKRPEEDTNQAHKQ